MSLASSSGCLGSIVRARGDVLPRILLGISTVLAVRWFSPGRGLPLDDAWIHQVVARTFAETGTLGYAPGQHGAAATSYLWAALLAINFKFVDMDPSRWALVLNALAHVVAGQVLYALLDRARPDDAGPLAWRWTSFALTLFATLSPNVLWFVCSGMEAMPFVALSLVAIAAATAPLPSRSLRGAIVAGFASGALALLRPEAVPLGALLAIWSFARSRDVRRTTAIALPWTAMTLLYVLSNAIKTGQVLPSTLAGRRWLWFESSIGLSRGTRAFEFLDTWGTRLGTFTLDTSLVVLWTLTAIAAYGAFRLVRARSSRRSRTPSADAHDGRGGDGLKLLVAWAIFHAAFYALLLPTPGHGGRYQPLTPILFCTCLPVGAAFALRELALIFGIPARASFAWFGVVGLVPWIALALPVAESLRQANALAVAHIQATELGAGRFVSALPEGQIASFDIGGIGYASQRPILDLGGLSDAKTADLLAQGRISVWLAEHHVRWLVLPETLEPILPVFDDYRSRLHLRDNPALELEPIRVFETPLDKWAPAITATWNAAPKQVVYEVRSTSRPGPREVPLVPPEATRPVADPAKATPERDRIVAGHMLAVLAAWGMSVDLEVTTVDETTKATSTDRATAKDADDDRAGRNILEEGSMSGPCSVRLGWWGFGIEGCKGVASSSVLRSMLYEQGGRYLDAGDLGGALRAVPHVLAQARRRIDPRFHPPIAPLEPPMPEGGNLGPSRASRSGLAIVFSVLLALALVELGAARDVRLSRLVAAARARIQVPSASLVVFVAVVCCAPTIACNRPNVGRAVGEGRGAVEIAIEAGGSVNPERGDNPPLLEAANAGDVNIVALLLERGARVDVRGPDDATVVHVAARRGHDAVLALVIAAVRREAAKDESRASESVRVFLDAPAGPRRRTALHDAVLTGSSGAVGALLAGGASPSPSDSFGQTPLHLLATIDPARASVIGSVLRTADAGRVDARGFTPLHAAAATDNALLVRNILQTPTNNILDATPLGESALDVAIRYRGDRAAEALFSAGAVVHRDEYWPPLHDAARTDAIERAALLVASGADTLRRVRGKTALDMAREHGSKHVEALLASREPGPVGRPP